MTRCSQVYIAQCGKNGPVKIGHSFRVETRIKSLTEISAYTVTLLRAVEAPPSVESEFHHAFSHCRIGGEWFWFDKKMMTYQWQCKTRDDVARLFPGSLLADRRLKRLRATHAKKRRAKALQKLARRAPSSRMEICGSGGCNELS